MANDFAHALGDPEGLLAAIAFRDRATCPPAPQGLAPREERFPPASREDLLVAPPWRENRLYRR